MSPSKVEGNGRIQVGPFQASYENLFLVACLICAFIVRILLIPQDSVINGDGAYYTILGERFVSGDLNGGISAYWSPLYSILTGVSSLIVADRDFAGRFVSILAGSLLIIPTYVLLRELFGRVPAYLGTLLVLVHPLLIKASGWAMTESLYTLILTTLVLSGWFALSKGGLRRYLVTGVLLGIAFLTKPEAIGYVPLVLILMFASNLFFSDLTFRQFGASCLVLLLGFGLFFMPYFLYVHHKTGQWTVSQKIAVNFPAADYDGSFLGLSGDGRMTMKDRIWGDDYSNERSVAVQTSTPGKSIDLSHLRSDFVILASKSLSLLKKQVRDYVPTILPVPFLLIAIAGFFVRPWTRTRAAKELYLFSFVLSTLIGYSASTIELRYLFPLIPILIAWTANGVVEFSEWVVRSIRRTFRPDHMVSQSLVEALVLILLLASLVPLFASVVKPNDIADVPFEEKDAGLWIKAHSEHPVTVVMSAHITPAYYAEARHVYIPDEALPTIIEYARLRKVDYLVFSERRLRRDSTIFSDPDSIPHDLKLVYSCDKGTKHEIRVYQVAY